MFELIKLVGRLEEKAYLSGDKFIIRFRNGEDKTSFLVDRVVLKSLDLGSTYSCIMYEDVNGTYECNNVTREKDMFKVLFVADIGIKEFEGISICFGSAYGDVMSKKFSLKFEPSVTLLGNGI